MRSGIVNGSARPFARMINRAAVLVITLFVLLPAGCNGLGSWDKSRSQLKDTIFAFLPFAGGQSRPEIRSAVLASDNSSVTITFSQDVYTDENKTGALVPADFLLSFTQNGGTATDVSIASVDHTAGTNTMIVYLAVTGSPSGVETIEIRPADSSTIFNGHNVSMLDLETSGVLYLNDASLPTVIGVSLAVLSDADAGAVSVTITFSKEMDTSINPSPTISGLTSAYTITGSSWSAADTSWTGSFIFVDDNEESTGTLNISGFTDLFSQVMIPDSTHAIIVDTDNPSVTVDQAGTQSDPTSALPIEFTIVFSEAIDPATFAVGDITQSGTATGITWALSTSDNITWTLSATAVTGEGTLVPSLGAGVVTDTTGNGN
ncbi:MAG: hypothetical protein JW838_08195, partial [Spirochaetes bacterium]|nr:hypothetical protein [Spirochaetota bacterium]